MLDYYFLDFYIVYVIDIILIIKYLLFNNIINNLIDVDTTRLGLHWP